MSPVAAYWAAASTCSASRCHASRVAGSESGRAILVNAAAPVSRYAAALFSVENVGRSGGVLWCAGCASQVDPWTHQLCDQRTLLRQWAPG